MIIDPCKPHVQRYKEKRHAFLWLFRSLLIPTLAISTGKGRVPAHSESEVNNFNKGLEYVSIFFRLHIAHHFNKILYQIAA